jgi:hypothetical protein
VYRDSYVRIKLRKLRSRDFSTGFSDVRFRKEKLRGEVYELGGFGVIQGNTFDAWILN